MFRAIKRHLAIRGYRKKLGPWLERYYGWRGNYSPKQVRSGVSTLGLAAGPICYAYAMFCTRSDFDAHHAAIGESCDYAAMHSEVSSYGSSSDAGSHGGDPASGFFDSAGESGESGGGDSGGGDGGGGDGGGGGD